MEDGVRGLRGIRRVGLRLVVLAGSGALVAAACGGGDPAQDFTRGGAEAEAAIEGYIEGWVAGSGPRRDPIVGAQARRFLGGELGELVRGLRIGGTQTERRLEQVYNEIMGVPFPPDDGYTILETSAEESSATVRVKLNYTAAAASSLAAIGLIDFSDIQRYHEQVIHGPERVLYLERDAELGWQVHRVEIVD
jgi:hypothetical protein